MTHCFVFFASEKDMTFAADYSLEHSSLQIMSIDYLFVAKDLTSQKRKVSLY